MIINNLAKFLFIFKNSKFLVLALLMRLDASISQVLRGIAHIDYDKLLTSIRKYNDQITC